MQIEQKLNSAAMAFSTNKATNKAYKKIFNIIYTENVLNKNNNEYGFAEINSGIFKSISKRKYKEILLHLYNNDLIFTNIPLNKRNTGRDADGKRIVRGYKIDRSLIPDYDFESSAEKQILIQYKEALENMPKQILSKDNFNIGTFTDSSIFLNEDGTYNLAKVYEYIDLDTEAIEYQEDSEEYNKLLKTWNKHSEFRKSLNRFYSWFHSLHGSERKYFTINGSHLHECFDIPACNFCILAKMLESCDIDEKELAKFQRTIKFKYIYAEIAKFAGIEFNSLNKKMIKASTQHWLNIRKCRVRNGSFNDKFFVFVDEYMKNTFPQIYETILNWREEKYTNTTGKTKNSKMLWFDYQTIELDIITKLINYLFKLYGVTPVTVHDAVYLTDKDFEKVNEPIEEIFWKLIDLKFTKRILTRSEFEKLKTNLSKNEKCFEITENGYKKYNHNIYKKLLLAIAKHIEIVPDHVCEENSEQNELFELFENILCKGANE